MSDVGTRCRAANDRDNSMELQQQTRPDTSLAFVVSGIWAYLYNMKNTPLQSDIITSLNATIIPGVTGATMGAGSDCYPYTIHSFDVSKTGRITIYVTSDDAKWVPLNPEGTLGKHLGQYQYTTIPPAPGNRGCPIKMWTKEGKKWHIGSRRYYQDPHF